MPITYDDAWDPDTDKHSSVKGFYCDGERLGRVRLWQEEEPSEATGEWFTVERWEKGLYVPQAGMHTDFHEALQRIITYGTAQ